MEKNGMIDAICRKEDCSGCHACFNACPVKAIEMREDEEGFWYPVIIQEKCIGCNRCKNVCPALNELIPFSESLAYAAYAQDDEELMTSSSGGVFAVLARETIKEGGVVCGAAFDKKLHLKHVIVETEERLIELKGTKYVQSEIGTVYQDIKKNLLTGKKVLFSGTPCQIVGLKSFLNQEYDNLLCVDLICHGVPSPKVFRRYLEELTDMPVVKMLFRDKTLGMSSVNLKYETADGKVIYEKYGESPYIIGFIQNLFTRPSCFNCHYKGEKRTSDITIGDFWGIEEFHPSFSTGKGVSAVIIHSNKGKQALERVSTKLKVKEATTDEIQAWNSCLVKSVEYNPKRKVFYELWLNKSIRDIVMELRTETKVEKNTFLKRVKERMKRWLA